MASTQSSDAALAAVACRLGLPPDELTRRPVARGVTHATTLVEHGGEPVAVLRLAPAGDVSLPGLDLAAEARLLATLAGSVPVPEVLLRDDDGSRLGRPGLVLRYVRGAAARTWHELRAAGGEPAAEDALAALVALHACRPPAAGNPALAVSSPDSGAGLDGSALARLRAVERLAGAAPSPLTAALAVLAADPPPATDAPGLAHGDFRPANLVIRDARVVAILDWEMGGAGDPARDLGIATMAAWGRWWGDAELLDRYRAAGGAAITMAALRWWRALGYAMVVAFLTSRGAGGPHAAPFVTGLDDARAEWEAAR